MQDVIDKPQVTTDTSARLPQRLHHTAWVVEDQERTRKFYEDILGYELTAFWIESPPMRGRTMVLSHAFYGLEDGSALAFFCMRDPDDHQVFKSPDTELFNHIAVKVDQATQDRLLASLRAAEYPYFAIEHGYCNSLYATDPDGLRLEFVVDAPDADRIDAEQRRDARSWLERWNNGERAPNNHLYTHHERDEVKA